MKDLVGHILHQLTHHHLFFLFSIAVFGISGQLRLGQHHGPDLVDRREGCHCLMVLGAQGHVFAR